MNVWLGVFVIVGMLLGPISAALAQPAAPFPAALVPPSRQQYTLKVDTSTTPQRVNMGCEADQIGGTTVNGIRFTGGVAGTGALMVGVGCTNGGDAAPGLRIGATGQTLTLLGSVSLPSSAFTGTFITLTNTTNQIIAGTGTTTTLNFPAPSGGSIILNMPAQADTLVGRSTTDTMTNKSISGAYFIATQFLAVSQAGAPLTNPGGDFFIGQTTFGSLAPGLPGITLRVRRGSSPGTCKLVAVGGTSSAEKTIIDNVGSGCT